MRKFSASYTSKLTVRQAGIAAAILIFLLFFVRYLVRSNDGIDGQSFGNILVQCFYRSYYPVESYYKKKTISDLTVICGGKGFLDDEYPTDKCDEHDYVYHYNEFFKKFQEKDVIVVEVGVKNGGSLKLWRDYFSPNSRIFGIDINQGVSTFLLEPNIKILLGDSTKAKFSYFDDNCIDIFIDDAYHSASNQRITFLNFFPQLCKGGLYIIEDVVDMKELEPFMKSRPSRPKWEAYPDKSGQFLIIATKTE
jgi:hypothetical protein